MPVKKMRLKLHDENGDNYTVTFEGPVTRKKAVQLLNLAELLGYQNKAEKQQMLKLSKYEKTRFIIERNYVQDWFSSKDMQRIYEEIFREPIQLSTVSTYLSRMTSRGFIIKEGKHRSRRYKTIKKDMLQLPDRIRQNNSPLLTLTQKIREKK